MWVLSWNGVCNDFQAAMVLALFSAAHYYCIFTFKSSIFIVTKYAMTYFRCWHQQNKSWVIHANGKVKLTNFFLDLILTKVLRYIFLFCSFFLSSCYWYVEMSLHLNTHITQLSEKCIDIISGSRSILSFDDNMMVLIHSSNPFNRHWVK